LPAPENPVSAATFCGQINAQPHRAEGAPPHTQPAKTTLFAGAREPGLRRNFLRPNQKEKARWLPTRPLLLKTPVSTLILPSAASKKQQKKHERTNFAS
jgi:hypothetical protein